MKNYIYAILIAIFAISCGNQPQAYKENVTEPIYLRQLVKSNVTVSGTSGSFFLIAGSFSSSSETYPVVHAMGNINGEYRLLEMNFRDVAIRLDSTVKTPYILIYTNYNINDYESLLRHPYKVNRYVIVCTEEYLPEKLLPLSL